MTEYLENAMNKLGKEFEELDFSYHIIPKSNEKAFYWLGSENEDIKICVLKNKNINESFHKHDFFFFNYAYKNSFQALSDKSNNLITINENECYIGQPNNGYALKGNTTDDIIVIGILIKMDTFFKEYLSALSSDNTLFQFFLNLDYNSDKFIRLAFEDCSAVKLLLEMMVVEYANRKNDTQKVLKPMVLALLMLIAREYKTQKESISNLSITDQIIQYINSSLDNITLNEVAKHFGYHPNYISSLLHKKTGKKFSDIILENRMHKAKALLESSSLSIEEISEMVGYSDKSNFYKVFKKYYCKAPREYANNKIIK